MIKITIPTPFDPLAAILPVILAGCLDPRGAPSGGVRRCGSGAVASEGCNTHTRAEAAEAARSRRAGCASPEGHGGRSVQRAMLRALGQSPIAVGRLFDPSSGLHKGSKPETVRPPGVVRNKASNTARGTLEKWRT